MSDVHQPEPFTDLLQHLRRFPAVKAPADLEDRMLERAKPIPPRPAQPAAKLDVIMSCTFCHDRLARPEAAFCASCLAPHHHDCFAAHGHCAAPGCEELELVEPRRAGRRKPSSWPRVAGGWRSVAAAALMASVVAFSFSFKVSRPPEWAQSIAPAAIEVAVGEVVQFEHAWASDDPPEGRRPTALDGRAYDWLPDNDVAHVEWAVPHTDGRSVFLIRGLTQGTTRFWLRFPKSRRNLGFDVRVSGEPIHAALRADRRRVVEARTPRELRQEVEGQTQRGEGYLADRDAAGKEGYYRDAVLAFRAATDAARALQSFLTTRGLPPQPELLEACEAREHAAAQDYAEFVERELASYRATLQGTDTGALVHQLRRVLRAINHACDLDFVRLKLILETCFEAPHTTPVSSCPAAER